jgi:N-succinyldiaminopimelate aminotransferase
MQFCQEAAERARVVAIPVGALCADPQIGSAYVRWAFCKQPDVLREATARLATAFA